MAAADIAEDFGQRVDLTGRIRDILANYPEGTTVLKELIQNADDAGATEVCFCLDRRRHGTDSLLYPDLAAWQGPALLAQNNAQFSDRDFESISKLGGSQKQSDPWKTGRFGVGFNAVYHLSDLPSFVSGKHIVFFDPHCKFLPNISAVNPGKRVDFVSSGALRQYKDQFSPYCVFGCDMTTIYEGTIFRFPLRTATQAAESQLSKQFYSEDDVVRLLDELHLEASMCMLFLKNIEMIKIYDWNPTSKHPCLLFSCSIESLSDSVRWYRHGLPRLSKAWASVHGNLVPKQLDSFSLSFVTRRYSGAETVDKKVESFVIVQCLEASTSRIGALSSMIAEKHGVRLLPWGAVAANISEHAKKGNDQGMNDGRAFCFLPLPVKTNFPVHINGFFELSSNRRDIWYGADMEGMGKIRSEWNDLLLKDVVAPSYCRLLSIVPEVNRFQYSFWPCGTFVDPWKSMVDQFYKNVAECSLLHSHVNGGTWVTPMQALFFDEYSTNAEELGMVLVKVGLPVVHLPKTLREMLSHYCNCTIVCPNLVRDHLRKVGINGHHIARTVGLALLEYCLDDVIDEEAADYLLDLPLIPLANYEFGVFQKKMKNSSYFFCSDKQLILMERVKHRLIDQEIGNVLQKRLYQIAQFSTSNVCLLTATELVYLLPQILPAEWKNKDEVEWRPNSVESHPSDMFMSSFWAFLRDSCDDLHLFERWPILPTTGGLLCTAKRTSKIIKGGLLPKNLETILTSVGCHVLRPDLDIEHPALSKYVNPPTGIGILATFSAVALSNGYTYEKMFSAVSDSQRCNLRAFLLDHKWFKEKQMLDDQLMVLKSLPLFEVYRNAGCTERVFTDLASTKKYLPPPDVDESLLGPEFLYIQSQQEIDVMIGVLMVEQMTRPFFFKSRVIGCFDELTSNVRDQAVLTILKELPILTVQDSSFKDVLTKLAFVPSSGGELKAPRSLYDPRIQEFEILLDEESTFPSIEFRKDEILDALRLLGLQTVVSPDTILQSAHRAAKLMKENPEEATSRGSLLLSYLEENALKLFPSAAVDGINKVLLKVTDIFYHQRMDSVASKRFWSELASVCWCPVLVQSPHSGLPWPAVTTPLAPPRLVRLPSDLWLASASLRILNRECHSVFLSQKLGWIGSLGGNVLAAQLLELGKNYVNNQGLSQSLATVIPKIYALLTAKIGTDELEIVKAMLDGSCWIWVGDRFVSTEHVVLNGPLHLAPYVWVIPADLAVFKELLTELGVKESLTIPDFADILFRMRKTKNGSPLDSEELKTVIWILQHLTDSGFDGVNISLFVPDIHGILQSSTDLVYDDAPWLLAEPTHDILPFNMVSLRKQFVHANISNEVADKLGVKSLRRLLLAQSSASLNVTLHGVAEAFGQHEALTTRLKHIVEMYADGPGILCELLQNSDDAGATEVSFLLDKSQFGSSSVLSPKMSDWQGPALYCFNDSVFTASDLHAISRIGQDNKLQKPHTVGRFGLGFNSVYHFTDVPGFVSGETLVMFDPHATYLPGISPSHPGLKINFVGRGIALQFPDQCRPFMLFGCDLQKPYHGTLFRFPLRTAATASHSLIKQEAYSPDMILSLFGKFQAVASEVLLFLHNVNCITVYIREGLDQDLHMLYRVERHHGGVKSVYSFVSGVENQESGRDYFYKRLQKTPKNLLPSDCQKIEITLKDNKRLKTQFWMVSDCLGGERAIEMAVAQENRIHGFVPWAGIAAKLGEKDENMMDGTVKEHKKLEGRAFCFLPLPVYTGLPIHVNGYFELSSNRRDIWYGDDMAGGGKLRSEWNSCLLEEVASVAYVHLLANAASHLGPCEEYFSLWPTVLAPEPWLTLLRGFYQSASKLDLPVLYTFARGGQWISAKKAVFPDYSYSDVVELGNALADAGLMLANAPRSVVDKFKEFCPTLKYLTPQMLRNSLVRRQRALKCQSAMLACLKYSLCDVERKEAAEKLQGLPLIPLATGMFGTFGNITSKETFFLANEAEYSLLKDTLAERLVDRSIDSDLFKQLETLSQTKSINVVCISPDILKDLLPKILPADWHGQRIIRWMPSQAGHPSHQWMELFWRVLSSACTDLSFFLEWPLLPTSDGHLLQLKKGSNVLQGDRWSENMASLLQKVNCFMVISTFAINHPQLGDYVHDATASGLLEALLAAAGGYKQLKDLFKEVSESEYQELRGFFLQRKWFSSDQLTAAHIEVLKRLPIFKTYGNSIRVSLVTPTRFFPPDDVEAELLDDNFIQSESDKERAILSEILGVTQLGKHDFYEKHAFRRLDSIPSHVLTRIIPNLLLNFSVLEKDVPSIKDILSGLSIIRTKKGALKSPKELYDPRVEELKLLLDSESFFPAEDFTADAILDVLVQLGLKRSLGVSGLLDSALSIATLSSLDEARAFEMGKRLLAYMNDLGLELDQSSGVMRSDSLLLLSTADQNKEEDQAESSLSGPCRVSGQGSGPSDRMISDNDKKFWMELASISWCPALINPPIPELPWPKGLKTLLAPPKIVRPKSQMWHVSASMRILDDDLTSALIMSRLGWLEKPNLSILAMQLIEISETHKQLLSECSSGSVTEENTEGFKNTLQEVIPSLYSLIESSMNPENVMNLRSMLEGSPWVWVGDEFVHSAEAVFDSPVHFKPYLQKVPSELCGFKELFSALGVKETCGVMDFIQILRRVSADMKGKALSTEHLNFAVRLLEAIDDCILLGNISLSEGLLGAILVPDANGILTPAKDLIYNDAPWIAKSMPEFAETKHFVHGNVRNELADRLGAKSLRYLSFVDKEMTNDLPCLAAEDISNILANCGDGELLLFDILEVANKCKARRVHLLYDKRLHPQTSVLQPNLGQLQGPALTVVLEGVELTMEEICNLQMSPSGRTQGQSSNYGGGLLSCYNITEFLLMVTSGSLYLFDPSGSYLAPSLANLKLPSTRLPQGKAYKLQGTDIAQRFADQFLPLTLTQDLSWAKSNTTMIRMPVSINSKTFTKGSSMSPEEILECSFKIFMNRASSALLFLDSVEAVHLSKWEAGAVALQEFFSVKVDPACISLRNPFVGKSWKKFQISNIFNSSTNSTKMNTIDVFISDNGNYVMDKWLVVLSFGFGQTRNLAVDRKFLSYSLSPVAGIAVHVSRNGAIPSRSLNSSILAPFPLSFSFRLPVHILGCFLISHEGFRHLFPSSSTENFETKTVSSPGLQQASMPLHSMWNQELMVCVCEAYLQLLSEAVRVRQVSYPKGNHFPSSHISRGTWKILAEQYYSLWPIAENLTPLNNEGNGGGFERKLLVDLLVRPMFVRLADLPLWELQGGGLAKATEGIFLYHPNAEKKQLLPPAAVCDYLKEQYKVFVVPCEFTKELEDAGVGIKTITPRMVRALLSSSFSTRRTLSLEWHLELLEYCCSDFEIVNQWSDRDFPSSEMSNGLPIQEREDRSSPSQGVPRDLSTSLRNRSSLVSQDPGGDALGVVANIGRAIVQFGKGVVEDLSTELSQKNTQQGHLLGSHEAESSGTAFEKWVSELKGLPCPTATSGIIRLGMAQIWLGTSEQQKLMLPLASRFMHSSCLERPLLLKIFTNKVLQQKLQIKPFVAQLLSDNLKLILPKEWVKSIGPAPWVAWNYLTESRVLSPSPEWLRMFWKNVETSTDDLSHFQQWPLIPSVLDDTLLTKIQHKDLVFIPPRLESAEVFGEGHSIVHTDEIVLDVSDYCQRSFKEIQESYPWVFSVLKKCCIPIFDQNFLDCKVVDVCVPASGQRLGQVIRSKLLTALRAGVFVASNLSLLPSDCDALFSLFALDFHSSSGDALNSSADLTLLRSLPIYKTTTGAYTSVDSSSHCIITPGAFFQPQNDFCLQYYPPRMGGLLYRSLGIRELSNNELLLRFCIPGFDNKSVSDQESILQYLYANWDSLQTDDTVVGALADMKFVSSGDNACRDLFRPRELLDPNVALFRNVYKNKTARFPSARYSSDKWLDILRKTGLQCAVDAKILLECAREVEEIAVNKSADISETNLILGETPEDVFLTASMVVEAVLENFASVYGNSFCQQLSEIAFIPAEIGLPIENGTPSRKVLTSYKQAALMKDWPLAWTCSPLITKTNFVPPEFSWPSLQLRSPPRFETVLRHLQIAGAHDGEDIMARWPSVDGRMSVEDAFLEVLEYLDNTWGNLSSSDKQMLEKVHFIPVSNGTRLCPANRIFVRLEMNLAPFIFQIPSSYLSFVKILSELGMQESPSFESMQKLLLEMQDACGYQRLNPNELRAVFEILNFLSEWDHHSHRLAERAVVPDDAGRLVSAGACVYIDAAGSAMISKIDTSRLRFVHPHLSEHLCIRLGVRKLSEVVEEVLNEDTPLEYINQLGDVSKESIIEKLQCECFQQAVWNLVRDFSVEISSLTSWSKLDIVRELVFAAENLKFVKVLYTRFIKIPGNVDVTLKHYNEDGRHRVYEYVSKKAGNILVAKPPNFVSLPELLSVVISKLLGSPVCLPLSCLLSVPIGSESDAARLLQLRTHLQADNRGRVDLVTPGSELSVFDATRVQIHPLRPYYAGEIVAWSSDFAPDTKLRYGRVVEDVRANAGQALYPIQVETCPRQIELLLSSNVFSFRSVSLEKPSERAPDQLSVTLFDPTLARVQETFVRNKMSSSSGQNVETNQKSFSKNVSAAAVVHAINDMLAAVGIPLGLDHQSLLNQSLTLQESLRETNEALSVEKARAETAAKDAETARAAWLCRVCLSLEVNSLLLPCGHVMCRNCCAAVARCPFCRKPVSKSVPLYRP